MEHRKVNRSARTAFRRREIDLDNVVYGLHAIEEGLASAEPLRRIHIAADRRRDPALRRLLDTAREREVAISFESRAYFESFPYKAHQGVIAFGEPFEYASLDEVLAKKGASPLLLVVLDHVTDPHNAGAIIRTAECAGADGVVIPERRSAAVNATVKKTSAGATAHICVARVANVAEAIRKLKKSNVWVAGADAAGEAVDYTQAPFDRDLAIAIGGEGHGLSQLVKRECDYLVRIPLKGKVSSLNASVAAAVLLYEAVRQRRAAAAAP